MLEPERAQQAVGGSWSIVASAAARSRRSAAPRPGSAARGTQIGLFVGAVG